MKSRMHRSAFTIALATVAIAICSEAQAGPPFGRTTFRRSQPQQRFRFNFRQIHRAGANNTYRNYRVVERRANYADRRFGWVGQKIGNYAGNYAGGYVGGYAGGIIGRHTPKAVTGLSNYGWYYSSAAAREARRQYQMNRRRRR